MRSFAGTLWLKLLLAAMLLGGFRTGAAFAQTRNGDSVPTPPETRWRAAFRAATDTEAQQDFLDLMSAEADRASVRAEAFLAVGQLLVGTNRRNVFSKWRSFRRWTSRLDTLIDRAPEDPDLRFLRVTVQSSAPRFLGYSGALKSDCDMVLKAIKQGYWDNDPGHSEFVQTTTNRLPECQDQ